jgi:hypothetical protein
VERQRLVFGYCCASGVNLSQKGTNGSGREGDLESTPIGDLRQPCPAAASALVGVPDGRDAHPVGAGHLNLLLRSRLSGNNLTGWGGPV